MKLSDIKITIYDRYIFKQVLITTFVAILLFTIVWIAPEMLLNTIERTLKGEYTIKTAILVLFYEVPNILAKAFPVGLLLGTLFTFDKLSKDSELTIFRTAGLSFQRIVAPVFVLSIFVTILCFITTDRWVPAAAYNADHIDNNVRTTQFIYTQKDIHGYPSQAIIVSKARDKQLENVTVLRFSDEIYSDVHELSKIYFAKTGEVLNDKWMLSDIVEYKISDDGIFSEIKQKDQMAILDERSAKNAYILMTYSLKKEREITNRDLHNYVKLLKVEGMDEEYRYMLNKYLQRFFHPLICILLAIMGCLLGFSRPREQRLIGFTIAIGCIFVYYITLPFFDLLAGKDVLPPILTASLPTIAFSAAIWGFYKMKDL